MAAPHTPDLFEPAPASPRRPSTVYQVSEVTDLMRVVLEENVGRVWVQGEVSNFMRPASGHWYFTLKDAQAQLRCVMFKGQNYLVRPAPKDGDSVLVRAQVSLYPARGDLQLVCEHLEPAGQGLLLRAFEQLKQRLAAEGLFDEHRKRALPAMPRAVGVITSATGAAIHDIRTTLARRFPMLTVYLYPVPVQGPEAAPAVVRALAQLPRRAPVEVVILARGGGSLEDLWAFNEEPVARAVRACTVPVVTGIGHEVDFTIADFAADRRAPTPTAAAELVSPDVAEWRARLAALDETLAYAWRHGLDDHAGRLQTFVARLQQLHPGRRLRDSAQRLDELAARRDAAQRLLLRRLRERADALGSRLAGQSPLRTLGAARLSLERSHQRLRAAARLAGSAAAARLQQAQSQLRGLNPVEVLQRGYAIVLGPDGRALSDARSAAAGDALRIRLHRGALDATVTQPHPPEENP